MLDDADEAPCARCRRPTPVDGMQLWMARERVRTLARSTAPREPSRAAASLDRRPAHRPAAERLEPASRPAAFLYATVTRADAVCPACHAKLTRGAAIDGPERWRTWVTLAVFLVIAAALVWGVPALTPNLVAAFWRNGAGGR